MPFTSKNEDNVDEETNLTALLPLPSFLLYTHKYTHKHPLGAGNDEKRGGGGEAGGKGKGRVGGGGLTQRIRLLRCRFHEPEAPASSKRGGKR